MAGPALLVIRNEEEAWTLLRSTLDGVKLPQGAMLSFDGWPSFDITVVGKDWHGTVPTRIMRPLLELQGDLHKAYAQFRYGVPDARKLSDEEREQLEIVVKVKDGSSVFSSALAEPLTKAAVAAVDKMPPEYIALTLVGIALVAGTAYVLRGFFAEQTKRRELTATVELSATENERLKIMAAAADQSKTVKMTMESMERVAMGVLKVAKIDDAVTLPGVRFSGEEARVLVTNERNESVDVRIDGPFMIQQIDSSGIGDFRARIFRYGDEQSLSVIIPLALNDEQRQLVMNAEWSRAWVQLAINARKLGSRIVDARVISVAEPTDTDFEAAVPSKPSDTTPL